MTNYYQEFLSVINGENKQKRLLLQVCCAPCLSGALKSVEDKFIIDLYFYNPNITDESEYYKRLEEVKAYLEKTNRRFKVIDGGFSPETFFSFAESLKDKKEGGERCFLCYEERLRKTAEKAKQNGYDYFATTLTLSPYKNADKINETGKKLSADIGVKYLCTDFKKNDGYKYSIEQSKLYGLYRQNYCGCVYSVR